MKKMYRRIAFIILISISFNIPYLMAEDEDQGKQDLGETRREILQFGTDEAVLALIDTLKEEMNKDYNDELKQLLATTGNPKMSLGIINFFRDIESDAGHDVCREILKKQDDYESNAEIDLLQGALNYIKSIQDQGDADLMIPLVDHRKTPIQMAAIKSLGVLGQASHGEALLEKLKENETSANLKAEIILALGELQYAPALETVTEIAEDEDAPASQRWYAAHTLGLLGDPSSLELLQNLFQEEDPYLKAYAAVAVSQYGNSTAESILKEALRDSHPRVRQAAAEGLGKMKSSMAKEALWYLLRRDQEKSVREAAAEALGQLGKEGWSYLMEYASDEEKDQVMRSTILGILDEHSPADAQKAAKNILDQEWDKDESWLLDHTGRILSRSGNSSYRNLFIRFLDHPWYIIRTYGVRGLIAAGVANQRERLQSMAEDEQEPRLVRKEAKRALGQE